MSAQSVPLAAWIGLAALLITLAGLTVLAFSIRRRQLWPGLIGAAAAAISYLLLQLSVFTVFALYRDPSLQRPAVGLGWLPGWLPPTLLPVLALLLGFCYLRLSRGEREQITPMSVKAAVDSLPTGLCFYLPGGRIVLVNRTMQALCQTLTGEYLANGERCRSRLLADPALPVRRPMTEDGVLVLQLPDETAWAVSESQADYRGSPLQMLMAAEVTELVKKSASLQALRSQLTGLNRQLTEYYQDIAALTTQKEILSARVRLHDEMGADLLMMQRYLLHGGSEADQAEIEARLRRSLSFLKAQSAVPTQDELQLIRETAERLGLRIRIEGQIPETGPLRRILATALHECMTNTLRHAGGDTLTMVLREDAQSLHARLTNNGLQPAGPIREQGGLKSLRTLTEQAGGRMTVSVAPEFAVCLDLPKEEKDHAVSRSDRG